MHMQDSAAESGSWMRGGFWRRVLAFLIDVMLVSAVIAAVGVPLYGPTDGAIRVSNTVIHAANCTAVAPNRIDVQLPADFKATAAAICVRTFFGHEHDRLLVVREVTRSGSVTYTREITMPVDAKGRVVRVFYLDYLTLIVLAAYLLVGEWRFGTTAGKTSVSLRVRSLDGGPLTLSQAAIRTFVRLLPFAPIVIVISLAAIRDPAQGAAFLLSNLVITSLVSLALMLILLLNFILTVRRRDLPWHDRWAGTEVVRFVRQSPPATQAPAPPAGQASTPSG
jgi:uncharacterized RDD family membrane protein YckC